MTGFGQSLQGRRVYGSGSYAPTRGQVSAQGMQGYLRREMSGNNQGMYGGVSRFGRDGMSDTRSGAAKAALNRQMGGNKWAGIEGHTGSGYGGWQNGARPPVNGGNGGNGGNPKSPAGSQPPPVGNPNTAPTVTVNDAGILELPYSPAWNQQILGGLEDTNSALLALQQQQQQQALQYAADKRQADIDYTNTQRSTLNDNSGRGVAFSSGYGVAVGKDANDHNNLVNILDLSNAQANSGYDFDRTAIINAFKDQLRQGSLEYADSLVEGAGTLGYGDPGKPLHQSPTRKKKKMKSGPRVPNNWQGGW